MTRVLRSIRLIGATGAVIRTAQFDGRDHLVVPVVALMEAVIHPVNAPAPELVPVDVLAKAPGGWNGRPLVTDHPFINGIAVSANSPEILESMAFGMLFNTASPARVLETKRLTSEAWIDLARVDKVGELAQSVVARAQAGEPIEVSVGAMVTIEDETGVYGGVEYSGRWAEVVPDHLAMLPDGSTGACSVEMGCGTPRVASGNPVRHQVTDAGLVMVGARRPTQEKANMSRSLRQRLASLTSDVLGVIRFRGSADVASGESDTDLRRAIDAALRETEPGYLGIDDVFPVDGLVVFACMPTDRFILYQRSYSQGSDGVVSLEGERVEVQQVTRYEPVTAATAQPEQAAAAGQPAQAQETQPTAAPVTSGAVAAASAAPATTPAAGTSAQPAVTAAASCQCQSHNRATSAQGEAMHRNAERIRALIANANSPFAESDQGFLEALTDERLAQFETQTGQTATTSAATPAVAQSAQPAAQPVAAASAAQPVGAQPAQLTEEQFMAMAPPSIRNLVSAAQAADAAARTGLIRSLAQAQTEYPEAELQAMTTQNLERLARAFGAIGQPDEAIVGGLDLNIRAAAFNNSQAAANAAAVPDSYQLALEARRSGGRKEQ